MVLPLIPPQLHPELGRDLQVIGTLNKIIHTASALVVLSCVKVPVSWSYSSASVFFGAFPLTAAQGADLECPSQNSDHN